MIQTFRRIGQLKMEQDGWTEMTDFEKRKYVLAMYCHDQESFSKTVKERDYYGRLLIINLDTENGKIKMVLGPQIISMAENSTLIFTKYAPADPAIYNAHHSIEKIMSFDVEKTINNFGTNKPWTQAKNKDEFLDYLRQIREDFFVSENNDVVLDPEKFEDDQRDWLKRNYFDWDSYEDHDVKGKPKDFFEAVKECFIQLLGAESDANNAFMLTIDGLNLLDSGFQEVYADALLYYLINKQYDHNFHNPCYGCSNDDVLAQKISLPLKFFGTTNPLFFDGAKTTKPYLSFSMCKECFLQLTCGMKYSIKKLRFYLLGLHTIVMPEFDILENPDPGNIDRETLESIIRLLERMDQTGALANAHRLLRRIKRFTLMFHNKIDPKSQEFVIQRMIPSVQLKSLIKKTEDLVNMNTEYRLVEMNQTLCVENFRFMIIPSRYSHTLKPEDYIKINKEITSLLSTYLLEGKFSAQLLIKQFVDIFNRMHIRDESGVNLGRTPFIFTLYLNHLRKFNQLQGERKSMAKELTVKLLDEKLKDYFENSSVYQKDIHAQGLFILGKLLRSVEKAMRAKGIKKTIVHRLNLRGIPSNKIMSVSAMIMESMKVWECYIDLPLHAYYNEAIADIKDTTLTPEEIVFHILNGRAFEAYQEKMYFLENPSQKEKSEEDNDDN